MESAIFFFVRPDNILGFAGYRVSVANSQLCSTKSAIDSVLMGGHGCAPVKLKKKSSWPNLADGL